MKKIITIIFTLLILTPWTSAQNALDFGGSDLVQTTYSGISGSNARTVEAWIKTTANCDPNNGGVQKVIADWGSFTTGARFTFCVLWANAIRIEVGGNGLSGSIAVNDGIWHHVAVVYDPASATPAQLYVDGVLDVSGSITVPVNTGSTTNLRIGQRIDNINGFNGLIDEVRVWNTAKTLVELTANMNNELCSTAPDLKAYYRMNQGIAGGANTTITSSNDDSGNGYTGTLSGFALSGTTSNWVTGAILANGMSTSYTQLSECGSYTWPVNSTLYSTSGVYSDVLPGANATGCDSIVTIDLTIHTANNLSTNVTECDSYTWSVNGQTYTSSTTVVEAQVTGQGCPYNHTLNLTLGQSDSGTEAVTTCNSYTWSANGQTYTSTGMYIETLTNSSGCDSIATLNLTIESVDNTVTDNNDLTITANDASATYQWLDCDNVYAQITGATSQTFTATQNGSYAVQVTSGGCIDTSSCTVIDYVGLNDIADFGSISIYPNPTTGELNISLGSSLESRMITVRNIEGRIVKELTIENTSFIQLELLFETGIYFIEVSDASGKSSTNKIVLK